MSKPADFDEIMARFRVKMLADPGHVEAVIEVAGVSLVMETLVRRYCYTVDETEMTWLVYLMGLVRGERLALRGRIARAADALFVAIVPEGQHAGNLHLAEGIGELLRKHLKCE